MVFLRALEHGKKKSVTDSVADIFKMVKSVDHESNTGSYVLCNSGVAGIF